MITLTQIIAEAVLIEGYDIRTSELHGLSQRGGSVQTHIRFGPQIYTPLICPAKADLILGLEISETLRNINFANSETLVLANEYHLVYSGSLKADEIARKLKDLFKKRLYLVSASEICEKELGKEVVSGIYLLGFAVNKKLIPLKPKSVLEAIEKVIPEKYRELNIKAFRLAYRNC